VVSSWKDRSTWHLTPKRGPRVSAGLGRPAAVAASAERHRELLRTHRGRAGLPESSR
jgi:hypothetical protein